MPYSIILLIYHAVTGLGKTGISYIASMSWIIYTSTGAHTTNHGAELGAVYNNILTSVKVKEYPSGLTIGMMYQSYWSTSRTASKSPPRASCN